MKIIFYTIRTTFCKFPFQDQIDKKEVVFYESKGKKHTVINSLPEIDSNTTIKQKEDFLFKHLGEKVKVKKKIINL